MRRKKRTLAALILFLVVIMSAGVLNPIELKAQVDNTITIAFTHDLHDQYLPFRIEQNGIVSTVGGWARLATAIAEAREKDPDLLVVDAGDYSMGTLFQMLFADAGPSLQMMGAMGYDVVTLGNHEFDFLPQGLANHLQSALRSGSPLPQMVASNIAFPDRELPEDLALLERAFLDYPVKEYTVIEKGSLRVGVFGLMGQEADSNAPMAGVSFTDQIQAARKMVEVLRSTEQVDLVICLSHSGTDPNPKKSEDVRLAQQVSGIDVIISGHSHTIMSEPLIINSTSIVSAGQYGANLGLLSLKAADDQWVVEQYQLKTLGEDVSEDPEISASIVRFTELLEREYLDSLGFRLDDVLAYSEFSFTPFDLFGKEHREDSLGNLIADSYRYAVQSAEAEGYEEIALTVVPSGNIRGSFVKGPITAYDAFIVVSLGTGPDGRSGFPLLSVYLTGEEIRRACEVDASVTPLMSSAQLFMSGVKYSFNPYRLPLNKVTDAYLVDSEGKRVEIRDQELYRVVVGLYSAQMLSVVGEKSFGLLPIEPKDRDGNPIEDYLDHIIILPKDSERLELKEWMALVDYLRSFPQQNGISQIPVRYQTADGRKVNNPDRTIAGILSRPNALAVRAYLLLAALVIIMIIGIRYINRNRRRNRK